MPTSIRETLLARYHYDPLDRLVDSTPFEQSAIRRYYCKTRLATETQDSVQRSIVQHDDQLLAQQQREGSKMAATLLATDQQRSILNALDASQPHSFTYTPYGHRPMENGLLSLLGFNGERPEPVTGHYHLGNGYRQFNPVLMRFNSSDSWSPFGKGGVNAYAYCGGDPINRVDPTGHFWGIGTFLRSKGILGMRPNDVIHSILNGAEITRNGKTIVSKAPSSLAKEVKLERYSTKEINKYIGAINQQSSKIYEPVMAELSTKAKEFSDLKTLHITLSNDKVLTHQYLSNPGKKALTKTLKDSVEFYQNLKYAEHQIKPIKSASIITEQSSNKTSTIRTSTQ